MNNMDTNKKTAIEALELCNGIVTSACKSVGLSRSTYYLWLREDEEFKAAVDEIQEVAIDYVESKLFEKIKGVEMGKYDSEGELKVYDVPPSDTAIIFYLKTKGKKRGYVEGTINLNKNINYNSADLTPERIKEISNTLESEV